MASSVSAPITSLTTSTKPPQGEMEPVGSPGTKASIPGNGTTLAEQSTTVVQTNGAVNTPSEVNQKETSPSTDTASSQPDPKVAAVTSQNQSAPPPDPSQANPQPSESSAHTQANHQNQASTLQPPIDLSVSQADTSKPAQSSDSLASFEESDQPADLSISKDGKSSKPQAEESLAVKSNPSTANGQPEKMETSDSVSKSSTEPVTNPPAPATSTNNSTSDTPSSTTTKTDSNTPVPTPVSQSNTPAPDSTPTNTSSPSDTSNAAVSASTAQSSTSSSKVGNKSGHEGGEEPPEKKAKLAPSGGKESKKAEQVLEYMDKTFDQRRKTITKQMPTIPELKQLYPDLFLGKQLLIEFQRITKIDIDQKIQEFCVRFATAVIGMSKSKKGSAPVLQRWEQARRENETLKQYWDMVTALCLLPLYFGEDFSEMVQEIGEDEKVVAQGKIVPTLVARGNIFRTDEFFLIAENTIVQEFEEFTIAFASLYSSYWVFNMVYPDSIENTYNYIQRCIVRQREPGSIPTVCKNFTKALQKWNKENDGK